MKKTNTRRNWYNRRLNVKRIVGSTFGAMLTLALLAYLSDVTQHRFIIPPLGASCFIAFVIPDSAFARPRSIIGGHVVASLIGVGSVQLFGTVWWGGAVAVGSAILLMQVLRMLHPPAAANPLLIIDGKLALADLAASVLGGCILLILLSALFHRIIVKQKYFRIGLHHAANFFVAAD